VPLTLGSLKLRLLHLRERAHAAMYGLPHGYDTHVDIDRRLTKTPINLIFDVGANKGQSATRLRAWYPEATIHCFEPVTSTFQVLKQTVTGWPKVHLHQCALGAEPAHASVRRHAYDEQSQIVDGGAAGGERVDDDTVDQVCQRLGITSIDYLKIDTEGHDLQVLKGAADLLGRGRIALVEVEAGMNVDNDFHVSAEDLIGHLRVHQYRLFGLYEQTLEWPTANAYLRRANLVFVSPETVRQNRWTGE
jgi:FkbM family methyltransferase